MTKKSKIAVIWVSGYRNIDGTYMLGKAESSASSDSRPAESIEIALKR